MWRIDDLDAFEKKARAGIAAAGADVRQRATQHALLADDGTGISDHARRLRHLLEELFARIELLPLLVVWIVPMFAGNRSAPLYERRDRAG